MDVGNDHWLILYAPHFFCYIYAVADAFPVFAFGLSVRYGLHLHPQSKGLYIIEYTFVVLSVRIYIVHFILIFTY